MPAADLDPTTLRQTLNQRLDELRQSIASTADSRKPVALDQASVGRLSRMDAMHMQAMAQAAERMRHREIARIEAALERLEGGEDAIALANVERYERAQFLITTAQEEMANAFIILDMTSVLNRWPLFWIEK